MSTASKKICHYEIDELAGAAMGWSEEKIEAFINDCGDFNEAIYEAFEIDMEMFEKVANALIVLTAPFKSELSGRYFHAFGQQAGDAFIAIAKVPMN